METVEYSSGRCADVFGDRTQPCVLMWHGAQVDARAAMRPLAELVCGHGLAVVVPDWNSRGDDGGREDLLASTRFAEERVAGPGGLVLVGWSLGGVAAAGLTIHAQRLGVRIGHTVCLAGAFTARDPVSGAPLPDRLPRNGRSPFTLLHGTADDIVPVEASRAFAATLTRNDWPVDSVELAADHAAIAGAAYDASADRYGPAADPEALTVARDVADHIADAV